MRTNFQYQDENIVMVKGDTLAFNVEVFDDNDEPMLVDRADFTCKVNPVGEDVVFHKSLGAGIAQSSGFLTVRVAPADTIDADAGQYFYDLQLTVGDDVYTVKRGMLTLEQDVTHANEPSGYDWDLIDNKPFETIGDGLEVVDGALTADVGGSWSDISDKPFNSVGDGLTVDNGVLKGLIDAVPVSIANGGTGNTAGYIHTGQRANTNIGAYTTIEGSENTASGSHSHAEGYFNKCIGLYSHTEGISTEASGDCSHTEGRYTKANYSDQHVTGHYNSNKSNTLLEIGNGTADNARSNAFEVYQDGHINVNGDIYQNGGKIATGVFTTPVSALVGDTTATITDARLTTSSNVMVWGGTSSGAPFAYKTVTVTTGQAVIAFDALTEATDISLLIM
jgi:hypothetical protein